MTTARDPITGRVRRESRKGGLRADGGANRNSAASQAVSTLRVGERQLGEEGLEGNRLNERRMHLRCGPGVGESESKLYRIRG